MANGSEAVQSAWVNRACPWLPPIEAARDHTLTRRHGDRKGAAFYQDALAYAQSQWMVGKPAQAILQLDKAWMADLAVDEAWCGERRCPYRALVWVMEQCLAGAEGYLGNPVRHFQHLASRMSGPRAEVRAWRAWGCLHLAASRLPGYPRDGHQLVREGLWIPAMPVALGVIERLGWRGEAGRVAELWRG